MNRWFILENINLIQSKMDDDWGHPYFRNLQMGHGEYLASSYNVPTPCVPCIFQRILMVLLRMASEWMR